MKNKKQLQATKPVRQQRSRLFEIYLLMAMALFAVLAVLANQHPYFAIDLTITKLIQAIPGDGFAMLMRFISLIGRPPYVIAVIAILTSLLLFIKAGLEGIVSATAAGVFSLLGMLLKNLVGRTRPDIALISVFFNNQDPSFPSGHVLLYTVYFGFLFYLSFSRLKRGWGRSLAMVLFALLVILVGPSRIYLGEHWFSDTLGAYLLGSVGLWLTIKAYQLARQHSLFS